MKLVVLLLLVSVCIAVPFRGGRNEIWSFCGTAKDHLKIEKITVVPDPPVIGQNASATITGTLGRSLQDVVTTLNECVVVPVHDEDVTAGTASIIVKYYGVKILSQSADICKISPEYPCPFKKGPWSISQDLEIPPLTPPGHYTGNITIVDQNKESITCLAFDVELKK